MNREEYLLRATELALRGSQLKQAVLTEAKVREIKNDVVRRNEIKEWIAENVSEKALCKRFKIDKWELWKWRPLVPEVAQAVADRKDLEGFLKTLNNEALAKKHGVSKITIDKITSGQRWVHVQADGSMVARTTSMEDMQSPRGRATPVHGHRKQGNPGSL